ncbi:tyrosine-type recombinase/integrase (plasmid) [Psychrobium sp. nBUS_13]|uniref:tyrosine-type recombinase/integrase n=1 Tax=Psychrobium sp. nBUS_13 TaxID=3395319 RepID=UPI003EBF746F
MKNNLNDILSVQSNKIDNLVRDKAQDNIDEYRERILPTENPNTLKAKRSDYKHYKCFCSSNGYIEFSSDFKTAKEVIFDYIDIMISDGFSKSTIKRRLSTISGMFSLLEIKNPLKDSKNITDYIRNSLIRLPSSKQLAPLRHSNIKRLPPVTSESSIIEIRNTMLMFLGTYTLCRASELLALQVEDIDFEIGTAFIARAKNDQDGEGRYANLSPKTLSLIRLYLDKTGISEGLFIRRIYKGGKVGDPLKYIGFTKIIKNMARELGLLGLAFNTHSLRIGSAVSLAENGVSLTEIALSGGWKNPTMPLHYTRQANAKRTGTSRFED